MTSVGSKFLCGRPHDTYPLPRSQASTWAWLPPPPCGRHKCRAFLWCYAPVRRTGTFFPK